MTHQEAVATYVGAFVDELVRAGVRHAVVSPGSRSTPIAMLMAVHPNLKLWMNIDERSAGFFALGMAKARREPVALLCTSGTAAANYLPAVVEAHEARVPLIVLTADRPHELRDVGAPQAINQLNLYGTYVKWFTDMALPELSEEMVQYVRATAARATATAMTAPNGPVHLNFPLREPLIPSLDSSIILAGSRSEDRPYAQVWQGSRRLDIEQVERLAEQLQSVERGLIVCGPQDDPALPKAVVSLAERLQFPIVADPLSQLRTGRHDKRLIIDGYDAFLRNERIAEVFLPEVVIRFGAMPVSKALMLYLKKCRQIVVDGGAGWREPTHALSDVVYADGVRFCEALSDQVSKVNVGDARKRWIDHWVQINDVTQAVVRKEVVSEERELFEGNVIYELTRCLPADTLLFVGNSMPVRDLDTFFMNSDTPVRTMCNRGANGIDGVVSTALGASTTSKPLVLVIGDLSFFHDLNGLLAAKMYDLNVTIIVVNNDGGGIFSFLPQADHAAYFETLFGTPTGLNYKHAVQMYGGTFSRITDWQSFREAVVNGIETRGLTVVEVTTDRQHNVARHRAIWQAVSRELDCLRKELS